MNNIGWASEEHPTCRRWVMRCWRGYLSGTKWKWFAYGPADVTATPPSLAALKSKMVYFSCGDLPWLSWKRVLWMWYNNTFVRNYLGEPLPGRYN